MAAYINTNISSLNAQRNLAASQGSLQSALQRLSSGLRVNSSKDDAAGLAIADRMTAQIRGNNVAIRNANDGISLAQTAEGALGKIGDSLQRMRELAVQSNNATNSDDDRDALDNEFQQLSQEIQRVAGGTAFNGTKILAGGAGTLTFQVGAGVSSQDTIQITTLDMTNDASLTAVVGTGAGGSANGGVKIDHTAVVGGVSSIGGTGGTIDKIDTALKQINSQRAVMGATQNRFESVISNLQVSVESQSAARSRIMDADFAAETANLTRSQILQQAGTAMLAQANSLPNTVLTLLRG